MNLQILYRPKTLVLGAFFLVLLGAGSIKSERARAQNAPEMMATYGRGVHAYFNNQPYVAEELFSQVIGAGSTDPRVYYFRAMTYLRSGRQLAAEDDMRIGAALEANNPGNRYAIGKALERVQGPHRRTLEKFRQQARMDRLQNRQLQTRQRYEQLQQREPAVLRRNVSVPLDQLVEPSLVLPEHPVTDPAPEPAAPATKLMPPAVSPDVEQDNTAVEGPADDDIFGEPAESADKDDPFGEPQPAAEPTEADDPFGEPAGEVDPAPLEDDPFGEPEADGEPKADKEEQPAEEEDDDPFAATAPRSDSDQNPSPILTERTSPSESSAGRLEPDSQVESGQMFAILGRVASSLFPWRSLEIPTLGPTADAEIPQDGDVEFGPFDEQPVVIQTSAEESADAEAEEDDLFGEASEETDIAPSDDIFGEPAAEEKGDEAKDTEVEEDDPFGDF